MQLKKNDIFIARAIDYTTTAQAVVKQDDFVFFVEGLLVGEVAKLKVLKVKKNFGFAKIVELIEESRDRCIDRRDIGLDISHMSYDHQIEFKRNSVINELRYHGIDIEVDDVIKSDNIFNYRNKAVVPVRVINGRVEIGFFRKRSHNLVPVDDFIIHDREIDKVLFYLRDLFSDAVDEIYDEESRRGIINYFLVRRSQETKEVMIVIIGKKSNLKNQNYYVDRIKREVKNLVSLYYHCQKDHSNVILSGISKKLYGRDNFREIILGREFEVGPESFLQINTQAMNKLYSKAIELLNLDREDVVIDAFCGIGSIGLSLADRVKKVYGYELNREAINYAKINAKKLGIYNSTFKVCDANKELLENRDANILIVDPPRKGLEKEALNSINSSKVEKMIYISCNPSTLARDLKILSDSFSIESITPVDLFPNTHHVEALVLMTRE